VVRKEFPLLPKDNIEFVKFIENFEEEEAIMEAKIKDSIKKNEEFAL